jgi:hypothetical protein
MESLDNSLSARLTKSHLRIAADESDGQPSASMAQQADIHPEVQSVIFESGMVQ